MVGARQGEVVTGRLRNALNTPAVPVEIAPLHQDHFAELRDVLDAVSREGRYMAFLQAPPMEAAFAYYQNILESDSPHFVALADGHVVGWCDVEPTRGESRAHVGTLGIGLLAPYRNQGLGAALMKAAISKAWDQGFTRIELSVRADNTRARKLYERMGFVVEGTHPNSFLVGGEYFSAHSMGLLHPRAAPS